VIYEVGIQTSGNAKPTGRSAYILYQDIAAEQICLRNLQKLLIVVIELEVTFLLFIAIGMMVASGKNLEIQSNLVVKTFSVN